MAAPKRVIKSAVDNILSSHAIVDSGYEGSLRSLSIEDARDIIYGKFRGDTGYLGQAKLLQGIDHEVPELLRLKEDFFAEEFSRLDEAVGNNSALKGFTFNENLVKGNTFELGYNEYQRQLRNFADSELETPNKLLREKISKLDPTYNFSKFDKFSWERQNQIFENELNDLQSYAADVEFLRRDTKQANQNFDFSKANSMSLRSQFNYLGKYSEKYKAREATMANMREDLKTMSQSEFSELWGNADSTLRRDTRFAWGDTGRIERYNGQYYREGIDDKLLYDARKQDHLNELSRLREEEAERLRISREKGAGINFFEKIDNVKAAHRANDFDSRNLATAWNELSDYEKGIYAKQFGEIETFGKNNEFATSIGVDMSTQPKEIQDAYTEYMKQKQVAYERGTRDALAEKMANERFQAERVRELYGDRTVPNFEPNAQEEAVSNTLNEQRIWRPEAKSQSQTEAAVEENNALAAENTELKTHGESQTSQIERKAANSILAADTARSYVFGYRQRALLGMIGTVGGISLLEAAMSGPSAETIERRRKLTEERRLRQLGY